MLWKCVSHFFQREILFKKVKKKPFGINYLILKQSVSHKRKNLMKPNIIFGHFDKVGNVRANQALIHLRITY